MKKILLAIFIFLSYYNISYGLQDCTDLKSQYDNIVVRINNAKSYYLMDSYGSEQYILDYNNYIKILNQGVQIEKSYNSCIDELKSEIEQVGNYEKSALVYFEKKEWDNAIFYFKQALAIYPKNSSALTNLGSCYYNKGDFKTALSYYEEAYKYTSDSSSVSDIQKRIDDTNTQISVLNLKKNAPTNDPLSGYQYYLKDLNITNAWNKATNSNQVIVAIIDDGIDINHPDLTNSIWTSPTAKYGSSKIIDFVGDGLVDNLSTGDHGTMIAGIIGASINNKEGIAGIAKNVKFMPLRVFNTKGTASPDSIIKAINYAIDNGANIINLSIGGSQFAYTDKYDATIKRAYDKGVVVVIAAGNGDILSGQQTGVNLTNNPISPVCNNGGKYNKYSIGVMSSDKNGYRTSWTNYGDCVPFMTPGEGIVSTSIVAYNTTYGTNYNIEDGTSFSAPMISGIIALGYNQYGYVAPNLVYDSLVASLTKNGVGNTYVDAVKYLDILSTKTSQIKLDQNAHSTITNTLSILNSSASNGDILASFGIVTKRDNQIDYRESDYVLRQEVVGMAIKIMGINLDDGYSCRNIFKDVSSLRPNNWSCRVIEVSADFGVVNKDNKYFRPEDKITRAEALAIIMKSAKIDFSNATNVSYAFTADDVNIDWQLRLTNKALEKTIIDGDFPFRPNQNATRGEIFEMIKRILKTK